MGTDPNVISVTAFLLADHAEAVNGKLYVVGGCIDRLFAAGPPPVAHPHMSVVATLSIPWSATNQRHSFSLHLQDEDGVHVLPEDTIRGEFESGRPAGMRHGDHSLVPMVFNLNALTFQRFGSYVFTMNVDGTPSASARMHLEQMASGTLQAS